MSEPRDRSLGLLFLAAAATRVLAATASPLVNADAYAYLRTAERLGSGGLALFGLHPLYPALAAAGGWATGDPWAGAALVSILAGSLALLPLHALARDGWGPAAARWTAFLYAVHPAFAGLHGRVLTEGVYHLAAFTAVLGLWRGLRDRSWAWAAAGGAALGAAYLARLEAVILAVACAAFAPLLVRADLRKGARHLALGAAVALLVVAPYLLRLRAEAGRWTLSPRPVATMASTPDLGRPTRSPLSHFARDLRRVVVPAAAVLAVAGFVAFRRGSSGGAPGLLLAGAAGLYLAAVLANSIRLGGYMSERYLSTAAAFLLPWSGWGLAGLMGRLSARPLPAGFLVVALALLLGGRFLRAKDAEEGPLRAAAEWLRDHGGRGRAVLCSRDALAWHADATFVGHSSPAKLLEFADAGEVDFVLYEDEEAGPIRPLLERPTTVRLARFGPEGRGVAVYAVR